MMLIRAYSIRLGRDVKELKAQRGGMERPNGSAED
jgi:hypothetical protein